MTVKNAAVSGDLFITDGVGAGDVTLENVTMGDRTLITGGGSSASFMNSTLNELMMSGRHSTHAKLTGTTLKYLTFLASGKVTLGSAEIIFDAATGKLTLTGEFDKITENADKTVTITINGMTFTIYFGADTPMKSLALPVRTSTGSSSGSNSSSSGGSSVTYCHVIYDANGGSGEPIDDTIYKKGAPVIVGNAASSPPGSNLTFYAWNTESDGSGACYKPGDTFSITKNTTLYALYNGDGSSSASPLLISTAEELNDIHNGLNKYYKLVSDIDLAPRIAANGDWTPVGDMDASFTGTLDGGGHTIRNLTVTAPVVDPVTGYGYAGLFGVIGSGGMVENLTLTGADIDITHDAYAYAGGIAGYNDGGTIENCDVSGDVSGITDTSGNDHAYAGGIAGYSEGGTIENCDVSGDVSAEATDNNALNNHAYAGGIAGYNEGSAINNCDVSGITDTSGNDHAYAGGIAGYTKAAR